MSTTFSNFLQENINRGSRWKDIDKGALLLHYGNNGTPDDRSLIVIVLAFPIFVVS